MHGTLLERHMPRACVTDQSPSQGGGQGTCVAARTVFELFANTVSIYISYKTVNVRVNKVAVVKHAHASESHDMKHKNTAKPYPNFVTKQTDFT